VSYLLDTNVISELIASHPNQHVVRWVDARDSSSMYLSIITIGEIQKGISNGDSSKQKEMIQRWLEHDLLLRFNGRILTLTVPVMVAWGTLVARLEQAGTPIAALDSLIAAIVLENQMTLVTRNESHFQHTGIPVINPWNDTQ
jgi:tRNA(fMet)-specific endonuclease VapC